MSLWKIDYRGISKNFEDVDDFVVFAAEPPWGRVQKLFPHPPRRVVMVTDLERDTLKKYISELGDCQLVVGLGGGVAADTAKYVALQTAKKFISIPSVVSVNAYLTPRAAVRNQGIVTYIGDKFPDRVVIDIPVIQSAPPRLNIAGVGDIYSTTTALMDWKLANKEEGDSYDEDTVAKAEEVLDKLRRYASEIKSVSTEGVKSLVELHAEITELQRPYTLIRVKAKSEKPGGRVVFHGLWPEEGCEHVYFYALEKVTGRAFTHGEAVGTGCVIGSYLHGRSPEAIMKALDAFGLAFRPKDNAVTFEVFTKSLKTMQSVALEMDLDYLVFKDRKLEVRDIAELWRLLA